MGKQNIASASGWLFDLYLEGRGMRLWFIREDGRSETLRDRFTPTFYVKTSPDSLQRIFKRPPLNSIPVEVSHLEGIDLQSGKTLPVLEVRVLEPASYRQVIPDLDRISHGRLELFTCDIPLTQRYLWDKNIFPLAYCRWEKDAEGRLLSLEVLDDPYKIDYKLPPLKVMEIKLEGDLLNPRHGYGGRLEIIFDGESRVIEGESPESFLETLSGVFKKFDPDLILSHWGDAWHFPMLQRMEQRFRIPLPLHRDQKRPRLGRHGKSYLSYGRIVRREEATYLSGRWHLDAQNSFILAECGLEGLLELARLSCIPVQSLARSSTGTVITAMQLKEAHREGILIPYRKQEPEYFKSAEELLISDKGGLVFVPEPGIYGDVAELDFASLYPTIMARYNISFETLDCDCCPDHLVPEINRHTCTKKEGLIPRVLKPILAKRAGYKRLIHDEKTSVDTRQVYRQRQTALKWILVTCFGYLGYKNARFGRIEAHEAVTAYGRELLLRAKEIAEGEGWSLLHALVDSIWVTKADLTKSDALKLCERITGETGVLITLEGVYRWLIFPSSRMHSRLAVPNRYFGVFDNGEVKLRGIEMRRRDTPGIIAGMQNEMIKALSAARTPSEIPLHIEDALKALRQYASRILDGKVSPFEISITKRLTRRPEDYAHKVDTAIASQSLLARGIRLEPGEEIQMIITSARDKDPASRVRPLVFAMVDFDYDRGKYLELLLRAAETVLKPMGYDIRRLRREISV